MIRAMVAAMALGLSCAIAQAQVYTTLDDPSATGGTYAYGISGSNIVGSYADSSGMHGFVYNGATYTTLNDPSAATGSTYAYGISGSNIVGYYKDSSGETHGFLYNGSTYTTIDEPLGSNTTAYGISGSNIVGSYYGQLGTTGFLYNKSIYPFYTTISYPEPPSYPINVSVQYLPP